MTSTYLRLFLLPLFILLPAMASAQSFEGAISGGVSRLGNGDLGSGYSLDNGFRLAFRATINPYNYLGYEFGYAYNRTTLNQAGFTGGQGMAIHQGFADVVAHATPQETRIRPFVAGGINFSNFVPPGQTAQYGQGQTKFGVNYGAGVKLRVTGPWHVRFDLRQFNTGVPFGLGRGGRFIQTELSAGISYAR